MTVLSGAVHTLHPDLPVVDDEDNELYFYDDGEEYVEHDYLYKHGEYEYEQREEEEDEEREYERRQYEEYERRERRRDEEKQRARDGPTIPLSPSGGVGTG